ncbi:hypothetical protein [Nonomuraea pusilla]|uniref:hypothetical protein n=1 Tax=Nonomuraea pusilla TaxID=46177 RepID=UPI00116067DD|nr:hypothetical protein [Nonomuraea pusilla]
MGPVSVALGVAPGCAAFPYAGAGMPGGMLEGRVWLTSSPAGRGRGAVCPADAGRVTCGSVGADSQVDSGA